MTRNERNIALNVENGITLKRISDARNAITGCAEHQDLPIWDPIVLEESE